MWKKRVARGAHHDGAADDPTDRVLHHSIIAQGGT
jgi:hypothetical protein